jgi:hypothetical protein
MAAGGRSRNGRSEDLAAAAALVVAAARMKLVSRL